MSGCIAGKMGWCHLLSPWAGRGSHLSSAPWQGADEGLHTHTGRIIPHIFSRADQPFTIPSPLRKWPSRPRDRQGGKRGTCWNWVGWSELWAICNRNCSQPRLNAFAVIQGGFCDHQPAGWSNNEKYNTPCPNPLNMVSVRSYPLAVLQ